jgi:hypothetical protein
MKQHLVIKAFRDKNTKAHHPKDSFYENEDAKRIEFLQEEGFLAAEDVNVASDPGGGGPGNIMDPEKESDTDSFPKHVGGGHYELSNGEKVQGKKKAAAAQKELNERGE